jgi:hypothetical protein
MRRVGFPFVDCGLIDAERRAQSEKALGIEHRKRQRAESSGRRTEFRIADLRARCWILDTRC